MNGLTVLHSGKIKLAALAAATVCGAGMTAPAALALNPQPLPPGVVLQVGHPVTPPGVNCREYGCM